MLLFIYLFIFYSFYFNYVRYISNSLLKPFMLVKTGACLFETGFLAGSSDGHYTV